jgi:hypothetical protein
MTGVTEHLCPDEGALLSQQEFARTSGLEPQELRELLDFGLLSSQRLDLATALAVREAVRLKNDFDLDLFSTGLLAGFIERIRELQSQLRLSRAEHPARTVVTEVSFSSVQVRTRP